MNNSKINLANKLNDMNLNGNFMLEPRLQEYLKKKLFYRENKTIQPCISPELEYQITQTDIKILREFLHGNKNIYDKNNYNKLIESKIKKPYFPSSKFKNKLEKNQVINNKLPVNRGMFIPDSGGRYYEDPISNINTIKDARDFPSLVKNDLMSFGRGFDPNDNKYNPRIDPKIDPGNEIFSKYDSQFKVTDRHNCSHHNKKKYNETSTYNKDPRNKYIISDLSKSKININNDSNTYDQEQRYGQQPIPSFNKSSEMDLDNKIVIPGIAYNSKKDLNCGNYNLESYFGKNLCLDTDLENTLVRGMPKTRPHNRSYGYRNPEENYYDYINEDFQSPDYSVLPWPQSGYSSRLDNKMLAKNRKYTREIM